MCQSPCLSHLRAELRTKAGEIPIFFAVNRVETEIGIGERDDLPSGYRSTAIASSGDHPFGDVSHAAFPGGGDPLCFARGIVVGNDDFDLLRPIPVPALGCIDHVEEPRQAGHLVIGRDDQGNRRVIFDPRGVHTHPRARFTR